MPVRHFVFFDLYDFSLRSAATSLVPEPSGPFLLAAAAALLLLPITIRVEVIPTEPEAIVEVPTWAIAAQERHFRWWSCWW